MLVRRVVVALSTAGLAACGGGAASTAPSASPSPSAPPPGVSGLLSSSRCAALRDQVLVNARTRQAEQAAGQVAQAQELARTIAAALRAARAIPGCDVSDLPSP